MTIRADLHPETLASLEAQRETVLRCSCGGTLRHAPRFREWNPLGECDRCGRVKETEAIVCGECAALFESFDGPDAPRECPGCRK